MVCEAFQTNTLVAALAAHSAKCHLLSLKTAFTASFAEWNRPMSSLWLPRTCCSSSAAEIPDEVFCKFDTKCELCSRNMVQGHFLQDVRIHDAHIDTKPEKIAPPFPRLGSDGIIATHLIVKINSSHAFVVGFHGTYTWDFNNSSDALFVVQSHLQLDYFVY